MEGKVTFCRCSSLTTPLALLAELLLGLLAAFFGQWALGGVLLLVCLLCAFSRLWAFLSMKGVSITVLSPIRGLFPGDEAQFDLEIHNEKFLPLVWLNLYFPLSKTLCMTPEHSRVPDSWEISTLEEEGFSATRVGEERLSFFLWYEARHLSSRWIAHRRGIYSMAGWQLHSGDGFGLTQVTRPIAQADVRQFAVYPSLVSVSPDLFLRNLWNAESGSRGVMEDPTIIRSTRDYQASDSLKHINWRLRARGLPLTVNLYEDILPKGVHFLLDGESFAQQEEALEEALSILASELVHLEEHQVRCGLSICRSGAGGAVNYFGGHTCTEELLCALAAYQLLPSVWDSEREKQVRQPTVFDAGPLYEASQGIGRFYYIVYDVTRLPEQPLLRRLDHTCLSLLPYLDTGRFGEFETVCLRRLKEGRTNG